MITTISPQVRLIALVGLLAAAALVVSTQLVFRGVLSPAESEPAAVQASASGAAGKPQAAMNAKAPAKADAKKSAATTDATKADARSTVTPPTKAKPPLRTRGLPVPLARALQDHRVVVVSLVTPKAAVDRLSRAEAEAGAKAVGAGFVALDVLRAGNSEPLVAKLGALKTPSVLVYTRPAKLFVELEGFADDATVAQAADNARR